MKSKNIFVLVLAGIMAFSLCMTPVMADTEEEIAAAEARKQEAEAQLGAAEAQLGSLESKKQELENYLAELEAQYDQLNASLSELSAQAGEKEEELVKIQEELAEVKAAAEKQYEAMKLRIVYMYENSGMTMLELLLSSGSLADFLNNANNVAEISKYDRDMLKKYEETRAAIAEQEKRVEEESAAIALLLSQKESKQQEIQMMTANTSVSILSYVNEISDTREEAGALLAQINSADNNISELMQQAAEEAQVMQLSENTEAVQPDTSAQAAVSSEALSQFDPETDTLESSSSSSSSSVTVEEYYEEEYYEEEYYGEESESSGGSSGQGTYLGNFKLTGYCNCAQCCGTAGNATASGAMPTSGHTVAMSGVPFGTRLLINGTVYTVEDLGTSYGHVDIYFDSHDEALSFGTQYADVYQL